MGCDLTLERPGGGATHTHTGLRARVHTHKERYQVYNISMINLCAVAARVAGALFFGRISSDVKCVSALSSGLVVVVGENVGVVPSCDWLHVDGFRFFFSLFFFSFHNLNNACPNTSDVAARALA